MYKIKSNNDYIYIYKLDRKLKDIMNDRKINLDLTTLDILYKFKINVEGIENYSKIAIKFFYENEIESLLDQFYSLNN